MDWKRSSSLYFKKQHTETVHHQYNELTASHLYTVCLLCLLQSLSILLNQ